MQTLVFIFFVFLSFVFSIYSFKVMIRNLNYFYIYLVHFLAYWSVIIYFQKTPDISRYNLFWIYPLILLILGIYMKYVNNFIIDRQIDKIFRSGGCEE